MNATRQPVSICALMAVRNEAHYLTVLLPLLASQGIEVVIFDNQSTDNSRAICSQYAGDPVIAVETIPYRGYFSLIDQLEAVQAFSSKVNHDWIIFHAPDEIMEHQQMGLSLHDVIQEADAQGYNAVNFDEFVFLPEPGSDYLNKNYYTELLRYYFFEPQKNRLNRAWKRTAGLRNMSFGGHRLEGDTVMIAPVNHVLRHYIVLSEHHAQEKYLERSYDPRALQRGWHGNKLNFTQTNLTLPAKSRVIFSLTRYDAKDFRKDLPCAKHFWEWDPLTRV